jgi:hypothetical protein
VSIEEFDEDYQYLVRRLDAKMAEEEVTQKRNFDEFMNRIHGIMQIVQGSTRERAVEIIAVAEGIDKDEFEVYGLESLEYKFDLKFGSIAKWLSEDV